MELFYICDWSRSFTMSAVYGSWILTYLIPTVKLSDMESYK